MPELLDDRGADAPATARRSCSSDISLQARRGRGAGAARPQRHGQDHAGQLDRRRHAPHRRHASRSTAATSPRCAPTSARMPASAGCRRSATSSSSLTVEENLTAVARPGRWTLAQGLRDVPAPRRAAAQSRQPALRRRAADAGDRPRADPQSAHHAARRAARRAGADHRRGIAGRACAGSSATKACRRSWSSRTRRRFWASPTGRSSSSAAASSIRATARR